MAKQRKHKKLFRRRPAFDAWQRWEYKHTTLVLVSLIIFILIIDTSFTVAAMDYVTALGYIGVFITGILFVSLFTAAPAVATLLNFDDLNTFTVAAVAALGAMIGDYLILKFVEDKVAYEVKPIAFRFGIPQTIAYLQGRRSTLGLVRILGALIIASPLPDEVGIGLLGIGKLNRVSFFAICYVLNILGILALLSFGGLF